MFYCRLIIIANYVKICELPQFNVTFLRESPCGHSSDNNSRKLLTAEFGKRLIVPKSQCIDISFFIRSNTGPCSHLDLRFYLHLLHTCSPTLILPLVVNSLFSYKIVDDSVGKYQLFSCFKQVNYCSDMKVKITTISYFTS